MGCKQGSHEALSARAQFFSFLSFFLYSSLFALAGLGCGATSAEVPLGCAVWLALFEVVVKNFVDLWG